jgi:hypothetical protein
MRTALAVAMLMCSISPAIARAQQSSSRQHARRHKHQVRKSEPQPETTAAPAPPSEPPSRPPPVMAVYEEGALSIAAENATLREIFDSVRESTGAAIDAPVTVERITVHLGPQPPVELIAALLEGTHLNYAILGGTGPTDRILRIIVLPKAAGGPPNPYSEDVARRAREGVGDNNEAEPSAQPPASLARQRAREH